MNVMSEVEELKTLMCFLWFLIVFLGFIWYLDIFFDLRRIEKKLDEKEKSEG